LSETPDTIIKLVEKFEHNLDLYKRSDNEEQIKQEFINPFFKALGWDVDNESGAAPPYRDVIFEDSIKVGGGTKAPDYCFQLPGKKMFFVEAKRPTVNIEKDIKPSYQLRRYAWSAKLSLSILTDFEEFAVYESRTRPKKNDRASTGRIMYLTYKDYADKWEEIYNIFSKEAVLKGSFDKFAESTRKKRGTSEVDDEFLSEIEGWRDLLARNIALRNPDLSIEELNFAVQQIIDRIVFLRMCEDRGVEKYEQLRNLLENGGIYQNFCELCRIADEKYNSGLFYFKEEKGRETPPDELTLDLNIDDGVFKTIITNLYYPNSPYEFSVLSPEILGNVYERFLGKVIRLTPSHQAKVEEKPEVKKAGGVYYTPQFIVDYIVENTVGKLCKGKTPNKISKLRILDPACGSGSFLLGAYTHLLNWHRDYYNKKKDKKRLKDKIYKAKDDEWHLSIKEKKRILLNNIYGVDIDHQAVEVTKLSLLLKVLEGENRDILEAQQKLFRERALPDLDDNIKCGNSLIGPDFYDQDELELSGKEIQRINAFDWNYEFKEIMENGGFDAVIGNPPYIRIQAMKEWAPLEVENYKKQYLAASKGNYDIYVVFVERGLQLLNKNGLLGFILPHKFFNAKYGQPLRSLIAEGKFLDKIIHFGDQQIFARATTYTNLLFLNKTGNKKFKFVKVNNLDNWKASGEAMEGYIVLEKVTDDEWNFIVGKGAEIFEKLNEMTIKLENVAERISQGIRTSANEIYVLDLIKDNGDNILAHSKILNKSVKLERESLLLFLLGREIKPYSIQPSGKFVIMPYTIQDKVVDLIKEEELKEKFPETYSYLLENKKYLEEREKGRFKGSEWYIYGRSQNIDLMLLPKILVPDIANRVSFTLDENGEYAFTSGYGITLKNGIKESLKYILGLLNSKLSDFYLKMLSTPMRGGFYKYETRFIKNLPIRSIDFQNPDDVALHDKIVKLVEQMLQLHKNLDDAKTPNEKKMIQRQIDATDKQIDKLVYELYDLMDEEIQIVKNS